MAFAVRAAALPCTRLPTRRAASVRPARAGRAGLVCKAVVSGEEVEKAKTKPLPIEGEKVPAHAQRRARCVASGEASQDPGPEQASQSGGPSTCGR